MSIQSEITRISNAVADAYDAVDTMGGTLPASQVIANLPDAIESIQGGGGGSISTVTVITSKTAQNGEASYTITAANVSDFDLIIAVGGGGNNDGAAGVSISTTGTITTLANVNRATAHTSSMSSNGAVGLAVFSDFATGAVIKIKPNYWGSYAIWGVKKS